MPILKNRQYCLQFAAFISHFIFPSTQTFISVWTKFADASDLAPLRVLAIPFLIRHPNSPDPFAG
jgi:hypothetical protein